jgi:hypothetical protein
MSNVLITPAATTSTLPNMEQAFSFLRQHEWIGQQSDRRYVKLANDDLLLYPGCIDETFAVLANQPNMDLVGARLRDKNGLLTHAGIQFDSKDSS